MNKAAIVIPFYKDSLTANEKISLDQGFRILGNHPIIAMKPESLDLSFVDCVDFSRVISFDNKYFKDIHGYNELMLSSEFYKKFMAYEYILIYQLDAFVFSDQLLRWCSQNYDYIGAPWLYSENNSFLHLIYTFKSFLFGTFNWQINGVPKKKQFYNKVGNGGFSLRRVQRFHDLSIKFSDLAAQYLDKQKLEFNEDIFWSIAINRTKKNLHIPKYRTALKFAFETLPERAYKLNQHQLPFGCHAWEKELDFWKPHMQKFISKK
ncbi:DUF5672 family protein [Pedobacter sp. JCM 36344]|uniref:DUF5672 family protein n=1 Tax=Pedobacter sp. JCM 36344 TaxID=3374280 RepID=UPI003979BDF8